MNEQTIKSGLINIWGLLGAVWRNKFWFSAIVGVFTILALYYAITTTPVFTARSTLLPHRSGSESSMANNLALFYGSSIGGTTYEDLIEEIVASDKILDSIITKKWRYLEDDQVSLLEIFQLAGEDSLKADYALRTILRTQSIIVHRDLMTGFISISVSVPRDPYLAAELANAVVEKVMEFNTIFHDSHAESNRIYLENRLGEIQLELKGNEGKLADFISNNRSYASSPELLQHYGDLRRNVDASNAAWLEVRRQLEVALLEAHKGPPVVEILDYARPPVYRTSPKRKIIVLLGIFLGGIFGLLFVLVREYLPRVVLPMRQE